MIIDTRWREIESMVKDQQVVDEYNALDDIAHRVYDKLGCGICVEIGSFHGKSTMILAQYFKVIAIDLWGLGQQQGNTGRIPSYQDIGGSDFCVFIDNATDRKLIYWDGVEDSKNRIFPICSTSRFLNVCPQLDAHFAFVDAEHTYPAAYFDMVRCMNHLKSGGILAIHDIARPSWGWGDCSRSDSDPWYGNFKSMDMLMQTRDDCRIFEHIEGIMFLEKK